jgi:hypothetical protein
MHSWLQSWLQSCLQSWLRTWLHSWEHCYAILSGLAYISFQLKLTGNIRDWFERKAYLAGGSPLFPAFQTIFCFRLLQESTWTRVRVFF